MHTSPSSLDAETPSSPSSPHSLPKVTHFVARARPVALVTARGGALLLVCPKSCLACLQHMSCAHVCERVRSGLTARLEGFQSLRSPAYVTPEYPLRACPVGLGY